MLYISQTLFFLRKLLSKWFDPCKDNYEENWILDMIEASQVPVGSSG